MNTVLSFLLVVAGTLLDFEGAEDLLDEDEAGHLVGKGKLGEA